MEPYELIELDAQRWPSDQIFAQFYALLQNAFPESEIRDEEAQRRLFEDAGYHALLVMDGPTLAALAAYWEFDDFCYVEHLAVDPSLRGGGIGGKLLSHIIANTQKQVILEAEDPHDDISSRRVGFYERMGFVLNRPIFMQPALQPGCPDVPLRVMSDRQEIDGARFHDVVNRLMHSVYQKAVM